jgi:predicted nucleic acid-binding Zn ribbon protein
MPIYSMMCPNCKDEKDVFQQTGKPMLCKECGIEMVKLPTYPAMVKVKGSGGYPSRRKMVQGTAPYS